MAEQPRKSVEIKDFPGLMNDMDPDDIPPGAAEVQINATCVQVGQLTVRSGLRLVSFED